MQEKRFNNKIGFHARNIEELMLGISIPLVDLVELKPDHLKKRSNIELYTFDGNKFSVNHTTATDIKRILEKKGIEAQIHVPYEESHNPEIETGLCHSDISHHEKLLSRIEALGILYDKYKIGTVLTMHPPAFRLNGIEWTEKEAMKAGIEFYEKLDKLIKRKGYGFKIGIENLVAPKIEGASCLGYRPKQIDILIGNTANIGITMDTGHRRLNNEMSISRLISYGEIVNVHFHSNSGDVHEHDYKDDEHILATPENLPHYHRFIKRFRRSSLPIVLEVKTNLYTPQKLTNYVRALRSMIER
jgi:sugar phosphate isomerase/epimerase